MDEHHEELPGDESEERPGAVLATTDQPVPLEVREIEDERVPEGMRCLGTFLDGTLVARCAVPPGAVDYFSRHGVFDAPRQLVLAAREEDPGLRCELYAIVPMPSGALDELAERIRALGHTAPGTYKAFEKLSSITMEENVPKATDMIQSLVKGHEAVAKTARDAFEGADEANDQPTADLLTQRMQVHEKNAWMLRSLLKS